MDSLKFIADELLMNNQSPESPVAFPSPSGEINPNTGRKWYRKAAHSNAEAHGVLVCPANIINSKLGLECIKQGLEVLTDKWVSSVAADRIERSYISICNNPQVINVCKGFESTTEKLEKNLAPILKQEKNESFVMSVNMIMTLFHGNAAVEQGFSVNTDCLIDRAFEK